MEKKKPEIQGQKSLIQIYIEHTLRYPWLFALMIFATIGMQAASLASPLYLREFFNDLALSSPSAAIVEQLVFIIVIIGLLSFLNWVMNRLQTYSLNYVESRVISDLMASAFQYLIGHSYNFFISNFAGTLTHRVSRFAKGYENILDSIMLQFFPAALFVGGAIIILSLRNLVLGLILGAWVVVFLAFQIWIARKRQPIRASRAAEESKTTGMLADAVGNQLNIALFSGSSFENTRFGSAVESLRAATIRSWRADEYTWAAQSFLMIFINVALLYGALHYWQQGMLTIGDFVLIQSYLLSAFNQLLGINWQLRRFYDVYADAKEMVTILNEPHEVADLPDALPLVVTKGLIEFKDVSFTFNKERAVLEHFSLRVDAGEKVALVGPSGAGKSTLTKLLLRLYDVQGGTIAIDGQNIAAVTQDSLRDAIAFVPQEPILFHRTLMENIRYGRRGATDKEVIEAATQAHCHEFISALPEGYNTFVGERGIKLSGGERQRVAIARAILKNAPILLLDEATSSLDSESEALIQDALTHLMRQKTVMVIAHRLSTIMRMDRIIVLEHGTIVAQGTHAELLQKGGLYHKLWSIQAGGFLVDPEELAEESVGLEEEEEEDTKDLPKVVKTGKIE